MYKSEFLEEAYRFSSCFNLDIENGMSPNISLNDKSLITPFNETFNRLGIKNDECVNKILVNFEEITRFAVLHSHQSHQGSGRKGGFPSNH